MPHQVHRFLLLFFLLVLPHLLAAQNTCIDSTRIDENMPCTAVYDPVCGCDGVTYMNACQAANWHGLSAWEAGPCVDSCAADFMFTHLEGNTFFFYNASTNYDYYAWDFAGELVVPLPGVTTAVYTFTDPYNVVCLYIGSDGGCTDTLCLEVYAGAPDEMCNVTDCVWPGDANGNARANNYDLLNIGQGLGEQGPGRPFFPDPGNPMAWAPNFSFDWNAHAGPVNFKHLDCDGNGAVEAADVQAIDMNYTPDFNIFSSPTGGAPPVYLEFEETEIVVTEDSPGYFELTAHLYVGEPGNPVYGLYGLAFHLSYPLGLAVPHAITADYDDNSFFGNSNNVLSVRRDLVSYNLGRYDLAFSRRNRQNVDGYGRLASLSFIIVGDIIEGRSDPETRFEVELDGLILRSAEGDTLAYDLKEPAVVTFINQIFSNTPDDGPDASSLRVFPNPAGSRLTVHMRNDARGQLELFSSLGAPVLRQPFEGGQAVLDTSQLEPGIYFLVAQMQEGRVVKKVVIE
ncbi:MAG: T9SS type A sorting domain-containing protein [Phaeodactylibacter sp.]|nr:T9SS type A sorting domain-containing protein [Phaeodactylibacter sp.]